MQDHRAGRRRQHLVVDREVVVGPVGDAGEVPAGHQHHLAAGGLDGLDLFEVGVADLSSVTVSALAN